MRVGALILLLVGGCNVVFGLEPADDDGSSGDDAAITDGGGDDGSGDDGGDGDGGGDDGSVDGRPGTIPGTVWALNIDQVLDAAAIEGYEAAARFGPLDATCTRVYTEGDCVVDSCEPAMPPLPAPDSGRVTIEGDLRLVNLDPGTDGRYPVVAGSDGGFFGAGTTLGAYSTGTEGVPPFSATLIAPDPMTFTDGALPSQSQQVAVIRAVGIPLRWQAALRGAVTIIIAEPAARRVTCTFPATAGLAEVPATVLLQMPAGSATLRAYNVTRTSTTAGDFEIQFVAAHAARRADGAWAQGTVILQ